MHRQAPADLLSWSEPVQVSQPAEIAARPAAVFHDGALMLVYEVHPYKVRGEIFRAYFNPLNAKDQKVVLYQRPLKHFRKPKMPEHGYEDAREPEYFDASTYYLSIDGAAMVEVNLNKRDLLRNLEAHRSELAAFIEDNDLNLRKLSDAVAVVNYYNSLEALN